MPPRNLDPFGLTASAIQSLIIPGTSYLPELDIARQDLATLRKSPQTQMVLAQTEAESESLPGIPQTTYSQYRLFQIDGDRLAYELPYFQKRARLAGAALRLFLGQLEYKNIVQDYLWNICEESNWVLPAHESVIIDLFSAETAFMLAETLVLLEDVLDLEIRSRVQGEIEKRVFAPYLRFHQMHWWYKAGMNWNGVCNSSIAAAFLLLESDPAQLAGALHIALGGLRDYLDKGFEPDGCSTEGVSYWQYGLINFVCLAEILRARTNSAIDLLDSERMRQIAAYPAKLQLSTAKFAPFSDCNDSLHINYGIIARLSQRTGEGSVLNLLTPPIQGGLCWRLPMMIRNILWWDGTYHDPAPVADTYLPFGNIAKLVGHTPAGSRVVMAAKAGHNDENHNHNDIGSFIIHVENETLLTDPGAGLYKRDYFNARRYENLFANSYGHSVPSIGGLLQKEGREFHGEIQNIEMNAPTKSVEMELARAYTLANLSSLRRRITLQANGSIILQDFFLFSRDPIEVEEALMTWCDVQLAGTFAIIYGQFHSLRLSIESPGDAHFDIERLEEACRENAKPAILKRLRIILPARSETQFRILMEIDGR